MWSSIHETWYWSFCRCNVHIAIILWPVGTYSAIYLPYKILGMERWRSSKLGLSKKEHCGDPPPTHIHLHRHMVQVSWQHISKIWHLLTTPLPIMLKIKRKEKMPTNPSRRSHYTCVRIGTHLCRLIGPGNVVGEGEERVTRTSLHPSIYNNRRICTQTTQISISSFYH